MIRFAHSILVMLALAACCPAPVELAPAPAPAPAESKNWIYLYARLHETQSKGTAEQQYLPNLRSSLDGYESIVEVEEITGTEGTVEFIGINIQIAAPPSATEALESLLMDTFRLSGAPYATQIFIVTQ